MSSSKLTAIRASQGGSQIGAFTSLSVPSVFYATMDGGTLDLSRGYKADFTSTTDGWTSWNGGVAVLSGGNLVCTGTGQLRGMQWTQPMTLVDGEWYELYFKVAAITSQWHVRDHWGTVAGGVSTQSMPITSGWNSLIFRLKSGGLPTIHSSLGTTVACSITISDCTIRAAQGNMDSSLFVQAGEGAASRDRSIAIGKDASAPSQYQIAIGDAADTSLDQTWDLTASAGDSVAIGQNAKAAAWRSVAVGTFCIAGAVSSTAIGANTFCGTRHHVALGRGAYIPGAELSVSGDQPSVLVGGSIGGADANIYFGNGWANYFDTPPTGIDVGNVVDLTLFDTILHGWDAWDSRAVPSITDDTGGAIVIAGGVGTGTATGGEVRLETSLPSGSSSNTKNARQAMLTVSPVTTKDTYVQVYSRAADTMVSIGQAAFYDRDLSQMLEQVTGEGDNNNTAGWLLETSTFSGWSTHVGIQAGFNAVRMRIREHSGSAPTTIVVRIKAGGSDGTLLGEVTVPWTDRDADGYFTATFPAPIDSSEELWLSFQADDLASLYGGTFGAESTRYWTNGNQTDDAGANSTTERILWAEFLDAFDASSYGARITAVEDRTKVPRINLPEVIHTVVGEELQLFHRSVIEAIDTAPYHTSITAPNLGDGIGGITEAKNWTRYISINPTTEGMWTLTYEIIDADSNIIATKDVTINAQAATGLVPASSRVLCVGDSLTAGGTWPVELDRLLTGVGGTPAGKGYTNISFLGTQGAGTLHEGRSGWSWGTFIGATSPFYNGGVLDINNYIVNTLGDTGVDQVYMLLTWNGWSDALKRDAADWATEVADAKTLIDAFVADYPLVKITLAAPTLPDHRGGVTDDYGDGNGTYGDWWQLRQGILGMHLAYQAIVDDPAYTARVDIVHVSSQHDIENNMPNATRDVNLRNATQETYGTNGLHPDTNGQLQIADAIYRHYITQWCS